MTSVLPRQEKSALFEKETRKGKIAAGPVVRMPSGCVDRRGMAMNVERIGISLEKDLLAAFDTLIGKQGYPSRSEAIRDLIRRQISDERAADPKAKAVAAVFLVYEHHSTRLMGMLADLQHSHFLQVISSMHIHLDEHNCLEIIVLRGQVGEINKTAENLISVKGVKLSRINLLATETL
jgi:CopG family nickel-responsive transcriptional regulator